VVEIDGAAREVALEPGRYAPALVPECLPAGDRGRVLVLGGGAGPPAPYGVEALAGLTFVDDCRVVAEEGEDGVDVALGVEREVALDGRREVVDRGLRQPTISRSRRIPCVKVGGRLRSERPLALPSTTSARSSAPTTKQGRPKRLRDDPRVEAAPCGTSKPPV
jgi:hypothetical protein